MLRVPKKSKECKDCKECNNSGNNTGTNDAIYSKLNKKPQSKQTKIALSLLVAFFLLGAIFLDKTKENVNAIHPSKLKDNLHTIPTHKKEQQASPANDKTPPRHSPSMTLDLTNSIIYGSQDKGEKTASLVKEAILAGFRHIASAAFHVKYNESATGDGIATAIALDNTISRGDLFLQTMYVPQNNGDRFRDKNSDDSSSIEDDVHRSIQSSLTALQTDYLDAVIYHNFRNKLDPFDDMMKAWKILESYVEKGIVKHLGIDHVYDPSYLERLFEDAKVPPSIVQNRFHANRNFDVDLHSFFVEKNVQAQKFWVLTGNGFPLHNNKELNAMAKNKGLTPHLLMYAFVMEIGIVPLIGTKKREHMDDDVKLWRRMKAGEVLFDDNEKKTFAKFIGMKYEAMIK